MRGIQITRVLVWAAFSCCGLGTLAEAQVVVLRPVAVADTYIPVQIVARPVVSIPVTVAQPVIVARPIAVQTVVPVTQVQYLAPALVATTTVAVPVVVVSMATVTARPVIVRPKYYVPGQPVRNIVRAVTP